MAVSSGRFGRSDLRSGGFRSGVQAGSCAVLLSARPKAGLGPRHASAKVLVDVKCNAVARGECSPRGRGTLTCTPPQRSGFALELFDFFGYNNSFKSTPVEKISEQGGGNICTKHPLVPQKLNFISPSLETYKEHSMGHTSSLEVVEGGVFLVLKFMILDIHT